MFSRPVVIISGKTGSGKSGLTGLLESEYQFPIPFHRGPEIFRRIPDYPVNRKNNAKPHVVEVLVDYAVPDIAKLVTQLRRMKGSEVISKIF